MGGFLGDAESYFPRLIQQFPWIRERPLFLPCIIGSLLSVVILILVLAFLPESLTKAMRIANAEEQKKTKKRYQEIRETMRKNPDYVPSVDDRYILQLNQGDYFSLICNHDVLVSCIIYGTPLPFHSPNNPGIYGSIQGGQDALYPIWLINSPENHGFSLTSSDLGWLYTGVSPMQIFSTPLLFPQLTRLMTNKQVSYVTGYIYAFLLLLNPLAALANRSHVIWQWIVILFSYGLSQCFRFFFVTYPCQQRVLSSLRFLHSTNGMVFITNSTYQDFRAKVNGLGQVMSAFGRFVVRSLLFQPSHPQGPSVCSNVFAWSYKNGLGFPFDYGCAFYVRGARTRSFVAHRRGAGHQHVAHRPAARVRESQKAHAARVRQ